MKNSLFHQAVVGILARSTLTLELLSVHVPVDEVPHDDGFQAVVRFGQGSHPGRDAAGHT